MCGNHNILACLFEDSLTYAFGKNATAVKTFSPGGSKVASGAIVLPAFLSSS